MTRDADTTNGSARRVSSSYDFWEHEHAAGVAQKIRHVVQMKLSPPSPKRGEVAEGGVVKGPDYKSPVQEAIELLATCLRQQGATVASREVAGVRSLSHLASIHA